MNDLLDLLNSPAGKQIVAGVTQHSNARPEQTEQALDVALPALVTALARNARDPEGARNLHRAVQNDHDGRILDQVRDLAQNPAQGPGAGILNHVLGGRRDQVERAVSKRSGLDAQNTAQLMETLAPVVLGMLGKQQKSRGLDPNGLAGLLGGMKQEAERAEPKQMSLIENLIDSDDDGSIADDIATMGVNLLGNLMKGRR